MCAISGHFVGPHKWTWCHCRRFLSDLIAVTVPIPLTDLNLFFVLLLHLDICLQTYHMYCIG